MLGLGKFKKIEIIPSIFSNHNAMRLEINYEKNLQKKRKTTKHVEAVAGNKEKTLKSSKRAQS